MSIGVAWVVFLCSRGRMHNQRRVASLAACTVHSAVRLHSICTGSALRWCHARECSGQQSRDKLLDPELRVSSCVLCGTLDEQWRVLGRGPRQTFGTNAGTFDPTTLRGRDLQPTCPHIIPRASSHEPHENRSCYFEI